MLGIVSGVVRRSFTTNAVTSSSSYLLQSNHYIRSQYRYISNLKDTPESTKTTSTQHTNKEEEEEEGTNDKPTTSTSPLDQVRKVNLNLGKYSSPSETQDEKKEDEEPFPLTLEEVRQMVKESGSDIEFTQEDIDNPSQFKKKLRYHSEAFQRAVKDGIKIRNIMRSLQNKLKKVNIKPKITDWSDKSQQASFIFYLLDAEMLTTKSDGYTINNAMVIEHGGEQLLKQYNGSAALAIIDHIKAHWRIDKFSKKGYPDQLGGFWGNPLHRKRLIDEVSLNGLPEDTPIEKRWYLQTRQNTQEYPMFNVLMREHGGLIPLLQVYYPDIEWDLDLFDVSFKSMQSWNQGLVANAIKQCNVEPYDWYQVDPETDKNIKPILDLADTIGKPWQRLVAQHYSEYEMKEWLFASLEAWPTNCTPQYLDWLLKEYKLKTAEDWYNFKDYDELLMYSKIDIIPYIINRFPSLGLVADKFNQTVKDIPKVGLVITEEDLNSEELGKIEEEEEDQEEEQRPKRVIKIDTPEMKEHDRQVLENWVKEHPELGIKELDDWYSISTVQIRSLKEQMKTSKQSIYTILKSLYPEHDWKKSRFISNLTNAKSAMTDADIRDYFDKVYKAHGLTSLDGFYDLPPPRRVGFPVNYMVLLPLIYKDHKWLKYRFTHIHLDVDAWPDAQEQAILFGNYLLKTTSFTELMDLYPIDGIKVSHPNQNMFTFRNHPKAGLKHYLQTEFNIQDNESIPGLITIIFLQYILKSSYTINFNIHPITESKQLYLHFAKDSNTLLVSNLDERSSYPTDKFGNIKLLNKYSKLYEIVKSISPEAVIEDVNTHFSIDNFKKVTLPTYNIKKIES